VICARLEYWLIDNHPLPVSVELIVVPREISVIVVISKEDWQVVLQLSRLFDKAYRNDTDGIGRERTDWTLSSTSPVVASTLSSHSFI
jgi:hypothetical protein